MSLPFHPTSICELPSGIASFLSHSDLSQMSLTNRITHYQVKEELINRKKKAVEELIYYFYYCNSYDLDQKTITIRKRYDDNYYQNVRSLFCCLPEIFQFIQSHGIVSLDFGCTTDYGGYPESPIRMISSDRAELERITSQLLTLLSHNTTLIRCNLGLFESLISHRRLINAIEHHPVIDTINMVPNGARTNFLQDPHILWRNMKDGSFYWNHFRYDDMQ